MAERFRIHALDGDDLLARHLATEQGERTPRDAQMLGEQCQQGGVGGALHWGSHQPDTHAVAHQRHSVAAGARCDPDSHDQPRVFASVAALTSHWGAPSAS